MKKLFLGFLVALFLVLGGFGEAMAAGLSLSWMDNSTNEDGFRIERCLPGTGCTATNPAGFSSIAQVGANIVNFTDVGLLDNQAYCYRVYAFNTGGNSGYSNIACATTPPASVTPPNDPSSLTVTSPPQS